VRRALGRGRVQERRTHISNEDRKAVIIRGDPRIRHGVGPLRSPSTRIAGGSDLVCGSGDDEGNQSEERTHVEERWRIEKGGVERVLEGEVVTKCITH